MKTSLGLLEVAGLALAVKAADSMVKAAGVEITGIERTNGSGWMLVSVTGDVASVNAAIADGAALARLERGWVADRVIARPSAALDSWTAPHGAAPMPEQATGDTEPAGIGAQTDVRLISAPDAADRAPASSGPEIAAPPALADGGSDAEPALSAHGAESTEPVFVSAVNAMTGAAAHLTDETEAVQPSPPGPSPAPSLGEPAEIPAPATAGCNLCRDPACTRRKGEPRGACIHYAQRGNV